jgi:hypothetical protein
MNDYVSINLQEIEPAQSIHHSLRTKPVKNLITGPNTVTNFRHDLTPLNDDYEYIDNIGEIFKDRKNQINNDYKINNNNRNIPKNTKLYQEAVIIFGREKFEQNNQSDILQATEDFCRKFEQKYGCKILMTSLHLDEGHKDGNGKNKHNYHTHILIENYNPDTHKTCLQKLDYRKLQTELAKSFEHLGFVRGDPEKKAVRLEHREYRAMKERETLLMKELKTQTTKSESTPKLSETAKIEISTTVQKMVADAFNEGRNSFALGLESLNDSALRSVALKGVKRPEVKIANVGYNPSKASILNSVERAMQLVEISPQKPVNIEETSKVKTSPTENNTQNQAIVNQLNQRIQDLQKQLENEEDKNENINNKLKAIQQVSKGVHDNYTAQTNRQIEAYAKLEVDYQILKSDSLKLQKENNTLKNAVERFLDLGIEKGISIVGKSIVERLNAITERFKKQSPIVKQENQKIELQQDIKIEVENSNSGNSGGMSR